MNQKNFRDMFELLPQSAISMPKGLGKDELGDHLVENFAKLT